MTTTTAPTTRSDARRYMSSKRFMNYPCSHRRYAHNGHCAWVHGYSRSFEMWFYCDELERNTDFVMDFGSLKPIAEWLEDNFDHTLLLDSADPLLDDFKALEAKGAVKLTVFDSVGMEGTARYVYEYVSGWLRETHPRVYLYSVECRENDKNSALYCPENILTKA